MKYETRPATIEDSSLIYEITKVSMREYVEKTFGPWEEEFQRKIIGESFDPSTHQIVLYKGKEVGLLAVAEAEDHLQLEKIYLIPEYRSKGLGSAIVESIKRQATDVNKSVKLRILESNRKAKALYERLGFIVVNSTEQRFFMEFKA